MIKPELLVGSVAHKELAVGYLVVLPMLFGKYRLYWFQGTDMINAF